MTPIGHADIIASAMKRYPFHCQHSKQRRRLRVAALLLVTLPASHWLTLAAQPVRVFVISSSHSMPLAEIRNRYNHMTTQSIQNIQHTDLGQPRQKRRLNGLSGGGMVGMMNDDCGLNGSVADRLPREKQQIR